MLHNGVWRVLLNPTYQPYDSQGQGADLLRIHESCFSCLDVSRRTVRHQSVEIRWSDLKGKRRREWIHGALAAVYQHEIDHCDGVVLQRQSLMELMDLAAA